jgi:hypothetical protein
MMISALLSSTVELSHLTNRYTAFYLSLSPISFAPTFNPIPHNTTIKLLTTRSSSLPSSLKVQETSVMLIKTEEMM